MSDRVTDRVEDLALPWFSRPMQVGTGLLAVLLFVPQVLADPSGSSAAVAGFLVLGALVSVATATALATGLKLAGLLVRVPLSLYLYPD